MKISTTLRSSGLLVITAALMVGLAYASTVSGQQFPMTAQTAQMENALERLETNTDLRSYLNESCVCSSEGEGLFVGKSQAGT